MGMAASIMPLDVVKIRGILERRMIPVQIAHPLMQRWIPRSDVPNIALEVLHVDGIEADEGHITWSMSVFDLEGQTKKLTVGCPPR